MSKIIHHLVELAVEISESATMTVIALFAFFSEALEAEQTSKSFFITLDIAFETFRKIESQMMAAVEAR